MFSSRLAIVLATFLGATSVAHANELVIEPASPGFTPDHFEFRRVSQRDWVGCWHYDVLQGSGWFPATWHYDASFSPRGTGFVSELPGRNWYATYCDARADRYNYLRFSWTASGKTYRGHLSLDLDGATTSDTVECTVVDPEGEYNNIQCTRAFIAWNERDDITIRVVLR